MGWFRVPGSCLSWDFRDVFGFSVCLIGVSGSV